jgi:crotonobetainyl-CoA:carnitine CoA-transferase CaiB-like acyl-CoA transferase
MAEDRDESCTTGHGEDMKITVSPPVGEIVDDLMAVLGADQRGLASTAIIEGSDPVTPSPHRLADAMSAAIATFGLQMASLAEAGGAPPQTVSVRAIEAVDHLRAAYLTTVSGVPVAALTEDPRALGNNGFYRCRDGRWIFLITTFAGLRDAVCRTLDVPPLPERIADAAGSWDAFALENAVCAAGGVCAVVRSAQEWAAHPAGRHLSGRPVVEIDRVSNRPLVPMPPTTATSLLEGVRVLDLTHVIAGPVSTKLLAEHGADVLHVSRADLPDPIGMVASTGGGKRNAFADLRRPDDLAQIHELLRSADVLVTAYRDLARFGLSPDIVMRAHPGIVAVDFHCWGADGPWGDRGGFDQLACSATGFAMEEAVDGVPSLPPTHLLNDYLAAYLGAAGIVAALRRRAREGGSWRVRLTLAAVCTWVRELGTLDAETTAHLPRPGAATVELTRQSTVFGDLLEPAAAPRVTPMGTPAHRAPWPLGSGSLTWQGSAV